MNETLYDLEQKRAAVEKDINDLFDALQIEVYKEQIQALQSELEKVKRD